MMCLDPPAETPITALLSEKREGISHKSKAGQYRVTWYKCRIHQLTVNNEQKGKQERQQGDEKGAKRKGREEN